MKTYNINGVEYTQDFLCISEIISVYQLIEDVFPEGEIDILNFTKELEQSGKILRFLNIILKGKKKLKESDKIKPVLLLEIITDFFSLNELGKLFGMMAERLPKMTNEILKMKPS